MDYFRFHLLQQLENSKGKLSKLQATGFVPSRTHSIRTLGIPTQQTMKPKIELIKFVPKMKSLLLNLFFYLQEQPRWSVHLPLLCILLR